MLRVACGFLSALFITTAATLAAMAYFDLMRCDGGLVYAFLLTGFIAMLMGFTPVAGTVAGGFLLGIAAGARGTIFAAGLLALAWVACVTVEIIPHHAIPQDQAPCRVGGP